MSVKHVKGSSKDPDPESRYLSHEKLPYEKRDPTIKMIMMMMVADQVFSHGHES
jgi:hypothetical protein